MLDAALLGLCRRDTRAAALAALIIDAATPPPSLNPSSGGSSSGGGGGGGGELVEQLRAACGRLRLGVEVRMTRLVV